MELQWRGRLRRLVLTEPSERREVDLWLVGLTIFPGKFGGS